MRITKTKLSLISLAGAAVLFVALSSRAAQEPIVLLPRGVFTIPVDGSLKVRDFTANHRGLYFLLATRHGASLEVLQTDSDGMVTTHFVLPPNLRADLIRVNDAGEITVLSRARNNRSTFLLFDRRGQPTKTIPFGHYTWDYDIVGQTIVAASTEGVERISVVQEDHGKDRHQLSSPAPMRIVVLGGQRSLTVDQTTATVHLVESQTGVHGPTKLVAPEVQAVVRPKNSAIVRSVAKSEAGRIYFNITGQKLQEGTAVLEVAPNGTVVQRFRCKMPVHPVRPGETLFPTYLGISGTSLLIVDTGALRVISYDLPK